MNNFKFKVNTNILVFFISIFSYLIFFYPILFNNILVGVGTTDALSMHYPFRQYIYDKLLYDYSFPFWSEKVHLGFPIYADTEKAYLSLLNILSILLLGPINSLKLLHFGVYILGSFSLYLLFKQLFKEHNIILVWLVGNFIYYFTFFHMFRQQLVNTIFVTYLIPTCILTFEYYFKTNKHIFLIFNALVLSFCIHWGQFNFVFLSLIVQLLYLISFHFKKIKIKDLIFYTLLMFGFNFYVLLPTYGLYINSERVSGAINFTQGSYSPMSFLINLYPFSYGDINNYVGQMIDNEYYINELYIYWGITTSLLVFIGLMSKNKLKSYNFFLLSLISFLILGFLKYIPFISTYSIPILNLFRFWMRSSIILLFGITLFATEVLLNIYKLKFNLNRLKRILLILSVFIFLIYSKGINYVDSTTIKHIFNGGITSNAHFIIYSLFLSGSLLLFITVLFLNINKRLLLQLFTILIIFDITYFSKIISNDIFINPSILKIKSSDLYLDSKRVIWLDDKNIYGNRTLQAPSWNLFGYSGPFEDYKFSRYLNELGFNSTRRPKIIDDTDFTLFYNNRSKYYETLGINGYVNFGGNYIEYNPKINLIKTSLDVKYNKISEGYIIFTIFAKEPQLINTSIRNYKGWEVKINNVKSNFVNNENDMFLSFYIKEGINNIELKYIPKDLYVGLTLSLIFLILSMIYFRIFIYNNKFIINKSKNG